MTRARSMNHLRSGLFYYSTVDANLKTIESCARLLSKPAGPSHLEARQDHYVKIAPDQRKVAVITNATSSDHTESIPDPVVSGRLVATWSGINRPPNYDCDLIRLESRSELHSRGATRSVAQDILKGRCTITNQHRANTLPSPKT